MTVFEPEKAEQYPVEAALTHVSSRISLMAQLDTTAIADIPPVNAASMECLGLSHENLQTIVEQIQLTILDLEEALL